MQQFLNVLLYIILAITSLFLICLVLIQRGKGGGLAGAFGGSGGSSAFGSKAGDIFTRVTMITAGVWIALNMLLVVVSNRRTSAWGTTSAASSKTDKSETVPPKPVPDKPGTGGESIELPAKLPLPGEAKEKDKTAEPAITPPPSSTPKVPEALPAEPKPAPKS